MNSLKRVLVIIPSFHPPETLPELCQKLISLGFADILIINDGSPLQSGPIFRACEMSGVRIIHHEKNLGKGEALRTGMEFVLKSMDWESVVFCDDDGQHSPEDVEKVATRGVKENLSFIIGTRDIKKMPLKSFIGNFVMTKLLSLQYGLTIPDTQSGLRCIKKDVLRLLVNIRSERFSFEIIGLIRLHQIGVKIHTTSIETIYFKDNKDTRFKTFYDSIDVLKSFLWVGKE
jgi:glycosyltransferase involved in cell wall biosynthesis